jgi:hypothetical protein
MTYSGGKGELEIVAAESVVVDCSVDDFFQEFSVAEEVFRDA